MKTEIETLPSGDSLLKNINGEWFYIRLGMAFHNGPFKTRDEALASRPLRLEKSYCVSCGEKEVVKIGPTQSNPRHLCKNCHDKAMVK